MQADIEAVASCGGHALPLATCLTVQNTVQTYAFIPTELHLLQQQADALLQDIPVSSCKIGVIPNGKIAAAVADIVARIADIPVVLDPVLRPSQGVEFCDDMTIRTIKEKLLPQASIVTPNMNELLLLTSQSESISERASELCKQGPKYVLLTDADNSASEVCNKLFAADHLVEEYRWPKLPHVFHGSGCTLSSALAFYLSVNTEVSRATKLAQEYTWKCLKAGEAVGKGQRIPKRINALTK